MLTTKSQTRIKKETPSRAILKSAKAMTTILKWQRWMKMMRLSKWPPPELLRQVFMLLYVIAAESSTNDDVNELP